MRIFMKAAASASAVGLLAFGAVAAGGGSAFASTAGSVAVPADTGSGTSVTSCSAQNGGVSVGLVPNCTAGTSTVNNPTSLTITLNTTALGQLLNIIPTLGLQATWNLSCDVNGHTVSDPGSYTVTTVTQTGVDPIDLTSAVGSPEPNSCTVSDLKVQTTLALGVDLLNLDLFTVGVDATATTAVPGAIYQNEGTTKAGAHAVVCADDTKNGNSGAKIQSYQCLSDLADYFVQTSNGQLVHNGACMTANGGGVTLATCTGGNNQTWTQSSVGGELRNKSSNSCLTATSLKDGVQLQVKSCTGKANQKWNLPKKSAAV